MSSFFSLVRPEGATSRRPVVSCFKVSKIDTADRRCDECDEEVKK
jgi:hypothetical protein